MLGGLFEWRAGQSPWVRYGVAVAFLLSSTALWFLADRFWPWGWGIGAVLLLFGGPSRAQKQGYRDF